MPFDVNAARQSGASDDQILNYLTQNRSFDVAGATKSGASKSEIIDYLSKTPKPASPEPAPQTKPSVGGFVKNVGSSATDLAKSVLSAVGNSFNFNPDKNTFSNLGKVGAGAIETAFGAKSPGAQQDEAAFHGLVDFFKNRYGSVDALKHTAYTDPVGLAADLSSVLDAGAGALSKAGEVSKIGELSKAGQVASKAAEVVNPVSVAAKGVGKAVQAAGKVEAPFASSFQPGVAASAKAAGVELPTSALTKSRIVQGGESVLSKGLFGQDVYNTIDRAKAQISQAADTTLSRIKPEAPLDTQEVGKIIKGGFDNYKTTFRTTQNQVYDAFLGKVKDAPATTEVTKSTLQEILGEKNASLFGKNDVYIFQKTLNNIEGDAATAARAQGFSEDAIAKLGVQPDTTFSNLKATRTAVGQELDRNPTDRHLNQLYDALSQDMNKTVQAVDPKLGSELDSINKNYKAGITRIQNRIGRSIEQSNPETLVQKFVKPNNSTNLHALKDLVGSENFQHVTSSFLADTITGATKDGSFDIAKFKASLKKYDPATVEALLGPDGMKRLDQTMGELDRIQELRDAMTPAQKIREGSQTAFTLKNIRFGGEGLAAMSSLLLSGDWRPLVAFIGEATAEYGATKFFTSNLGKKYLTEGFNVIRPAGRAIEKASPALVREPMSAAQQMLRTNVLPG